MTDITDTTPTANRHSDDLVIDCGTCVMRRTEACTDCLVTFLLDADDARATDCSTALVRSSTIRHPASAEARRRSGAAIEAGWTEQAMVFDIAEQRAMRTLAAAGLLPGLRYQDGN
jgi:hypothetical protein